MTMLRPSVSLLSVLTPKKRRQTDNGLSPSPKRLCLWGNTPEDPITKDWSTLRIRRPTCQLFAKFTPSSTPKRVIKSNLLVHSARKIRRPQVRLSSRSRSKSLTPLNYTRSSCSSSPSRKSNIEWSSDVQVMERLKSLHRPGVSSLNRLAVRRKTEVKKRSRSLSLSTDRSSSVRSKSHDALCYSPMVRRKRARINSMFTPPSRTRKSNRKLLLTRSTNKAKLHKNSSRLQVMNREKVNIGTAKSVEAELVELQTLTQRLMVQLASATLKMEALNRESTFYKSLVAEIENIISLNTKNNVLFSSFPKMQL